MLSRLELRRQTLHILFGVFLVTLIYYDVFNVWHLLLLLIGGIILSQLCVHYRVPLASYVMDHFEREEFRKTFPGKGPIFFLIGSIIVLALFSKETALAAMMILSVGDAASHVFGKLLSSRTYTYLKSIEGTVIGIILASFGALIFVEVWIAIAASVISMMVENIKSRIDDNLVVPVVAALVIALLSV